MTLLRKFRANRLAVVAPVAVFLSLIIVTALGAATVAALSIVNQTPKDGATVAGSIPWIVTVV